MVIATVCPPKSHHRSSSGHHPGGGGEMNHTTATPTSPRVTSTERLMRAMVSTPSAAPRSARIFTGLVHRRAQAYCVERIHRPAKVPRRPGPGSSSMRMPATRTSHPRVSRTRRLAAAFTEDQPRGAGPGSRAPTTFPGDRTPPCLATCRHRWKGTAFPRNRERSRACGSDEQAAQVRQNPERHEHPVPADVLQELVERVQDVEVEARESGVWPQ